MVRLYCLLVGYLFGMIETAYFYGKYKGIDIREHGSGNAGTTNTLRVLGRKAGAIVFAGDVLKCAIPVFVVSLICRQFYPEMIYLVKIYTAAGVILGHDYPFYLKFKGGKGIACLVGAILSFHIGMLPGAIMVFFIFFFMTHYVSLSSIMMCLMFMTQIVVFGQMGWLHMDAVYIQELYIVSGILVVLAIWQHRQNIVRLFKHEERKTYLKKKAED